MKKTFRDFFHHEFEVRLSVSPLDTITAPHAQLSGISLLSPAGDGPFPCADEAGIEKTFDLLRDLRPGILRFSADSPERDRWMMFCRNEEIHPHICFSADMDRDEAAALVKRCAAEFTENDLWKPIRFYEVVCDPDTVPFDDDRALEERIDAVRRFGKMLRDSDPEAKIIMGGIAPIGEKRARAEIWNCGMVRKCSDFMDLAGVFLQPSVPAGRVWNEDEEAVEARFSLAEQVRMGLLRLDRQIRESAPDSDIRIAVTGWGFLCDGMPAERQDGVYYSAVYSAIRRACGKAAVNEAGPLFGPGGLLRYEDGIVFGDVFYHHQLLAARDLPVCLEVREPEFEKPVPVFHWDGIPGVLEGGEMKMAETHAARSRDGKRLFFLISNRSPFRQCVLRVRFYDVPDLHPIEAHILKSANRRDSVSAQQTDTVWCKEVRLGNCRRMNHVTVEIPPCSSVSMLLE